MLAEIDAAFATLHAASGKTGQGLRENEWLMAIKQRAGIPGGTSDDPVEVVLRLGVKGHDEAKLDRFGTELVPLVTSGPPGVTGFAGGRPKPTEIIGYWPALVRKDHIRPRVSVFTS